VKQILLFQHVPEEGPGFLREVLPRLGFNFEIFHSYSGLEFPNPRNFLGAISLGGFMGANDDSDHPWLNSEILWMKDALSARKKVFGICLGAQLLARALGGNVTRNPVPEIGWYPIEWTEQGRKLYGEDPFVFHWHQDTFHLPESSALTWLAKSPSCTRQGFLWSDLAMGVQFHPEVNQQELRTWVAHPEGQKDILDKRSQFGSHSVMSPEELMNTPAHRYLANCQLLEKLVSKFFR